MRKWILAVAALALLVAIYHSTRRAASRPHAVSAQPVTGGHAGPHVGPRASRRWLPGLDRTAHIDFGIAIGAGTGAAQLGVSGDWHTTLVDNGDDSHVMRVELIDGRLVGSDGSTSPDVVAEIARPWFIELDDKGTIQAAWFEPQISRAARDVLKSIAAYQQFCAAEDGGCDRPEQDATGTYQAHYTFADGDRVTRAKDHYLQVVTPRGRLSPEAAGGPNVRASDARFELDDEGWPVRITVEEVLTASMPDANDKSEPKTPRDALEIHARLTAEPVAATSRTDLAGAFAAARPALRRYAPLAEAPDRVATSQALDRQLVGGASFENLARDLQTAADEHVESAILRRMRALFALQPNAAIRAAALLRSGALRDSGAKTLVAALAASGTPEAQKAVVDFLNDSKTADMRLQALASLGGTPTPTEDTVDALAKVADQPATPNDRSTALLALGSTGRTVADAVSILLDRLKNAATSEDQMLCLRALGNSGDPRALPAILQALHSSQPAMRVAAAVALRLIDDPTVDPIVERLMASDPDPSVRAAAVFAASMRPIDDMLPSLTAGLRNEPDAAVRVRIVKALGQHLDNPTCASLLAWAVANDPAESVRSAAGRPGGYAL